MNKETINILNVHCDTLEIPQTYEGIRNAIEYIWHQLYHENDSSCGDILDKMIETNNAKILRHIPIYLMAPDELHHDHDDEPICNNPLEKYQLSQASHVNIVEHMTYVSTTLNVLIESNWVGDLTYLCEPTPYHQKIITVSVDCPMYFNNELQKYIGMFNDFSVTEIENDEVSFVMPSWFSIKEGFYEKTPKENFIKIDDTIYEVKLPLIIQYLNSLFDAKKLYDNMISYGVEKKNAVRCLPSTLRSSFVMTAPENAFVKLSSFASLKNTELGKFLRTITSKIKD